MELPFNETLGTFLNDPLADWLPPADRPHVERLRAELNRMEHPVSLEAQVCWQTPATQTIGLLERFAVNYRLCPSKIHVLPRNFITAHVCFACISAAMYKQCARCKCVFLWKKLAEHYLSNVDGPICTQCGLELEEGYAGRANMSREVLTPRQRHYEAHNSSRRYRVGHEGLYGHSGPLPVGHLDWGTEEDVSETDSVSTIHSGTVLFVPTLSSESSVLSDSDTDTEEL